MRFRVLLSVLLFGCHHEKELVSVIDCGKPCGSSVGSCRQGSTHCTDDGGIICVGAIGPAAEDCDGLDNDCDGIVDNHLPISEEFADCPGQCNKPGIQVCDQGRWRCEPSQVPHPEVCNGIDDDCDGLIDDIVWDGGVYCYEGPPNTAGHGPCHPGVWQCVQQQTGWSSKCVGEVLPSPEYCNEIDDNCDGIVDNGTGCTNPRDLRITADWNYPNDFDIHLLNRRDGGTIDDGYFPNGWTTFPMDCFYADMDPIWSSDTLENPHLAFDDVYGPGPEVTTVTKMSTTDEYTIGLHLYELKSGSTPATVHVTVSCGGAQLIDRKLTMSNWQFWLIGRIRYTQTDPCHFEEVGDGGFTF